MSYCNLNPYLLLLEPFSVDLWQYVLGNELHSFAVHFVEMYYIVAAHIPCPMLSYDTTPFL